MKLKTLLIILVVFFILRAINSPYAKTPTTAQLVSTATTLRKAATAAATKAVKAEAAASAAVGTSTAAQLVATATTLRKAATAATTKAVKAEAAAATAGGVIPKGFAGTVGAPTSQGKWMIMDLAEGNVAIYNKTTPPTFTVLQQTFSPLAYGHCLTVRNMFILVGPGITTILTVNLATQTWTSKNGPIAGTYALGDDPWASVMGDTLISYGGMTTTYIPAIDSWTAPIQGPPAINYQLEPSWHIWTCIMGNMAIANPSRVSIYQNGIWSPMQPGPQVPMVGNRPDWWACVMGYTVIGSKGSTSTYIPGSNGTYGTWSTPSPTLPTLTNDSWAFVVDNMVISHGGTICQQNADGSFSVDTTLSMPGNGNWCGSMKLN